ncbi:suppressor of forked protein [Opisthorchis viverrini]|uniref:Suppressor of forked protein n=1 Tax=Opisthorchis viverrini TaxID=6198 RepID=A0A1S8X2U7_OPIVI|nr:suppressor of forked protein [Opisthorchis viverrini]
MPFMQRRVYKMDKMQKAEERIKANPWDIEAWSVLLRDAQSKKVEDARDVFERIVNQFPFAGQYWKIYINQEMKAKNFERVEKLFQRCLVKILNIDLWKLYLQYIKDTKGKHHAFKYIIFAHCIFIFTREKMAQAYDFTLDKMGLDLNSYSIWADYISFLRSTQVQGSYAESQKITATRRVYQRSIVTPMLGIETIWRDYCMYENSINPLIAKKFTEERSRDYMNARRVAKEYEVITKGLSRNMPSIPPQNTPYEAKQVELWKKYIQWEKDNPLKTEDIITTTKRVMFAYEQCLLCLGHHPDIWYEAASHLEHASKVLMEKGDQTTARQFANETASMYERAIALLKTNMMLYFAYADYEEGRCKFAKVHSIYKKLISLENIDPTLPYIQYMRFARRAEGILSARHVFKLARDDSRISYHVYCAAAFMEYYCSKDKEIGHKIFELGMKRFGGNADYILCYVDFMTHLNEDNNIRVLFERALGSNQVASERARVIWARFLQFESQVGDLASILKVEKRRLQALETVKEVSRLESALLIDRYRFLDLLPCSDSELKSLGYRELARFQFAGSGRGYDEFFGSVLAPHVGLSTALSLGVGSTMGDPSVLSGSSGDQRPAYPQPDVSQMLPFKPKAYPRTGSHPVGGGEFPPPPAASALLRLLPPPECFHGPFVEIDKFMEHFLELEIPDDYMEIVNAESEELSNSIDPGTALSIELASTASSTAPMLLAARKRRQQLNIDVVSGTATRLGATNANQLKARKRPALNAFGDSEDEADEEDDDDDEDERAAALLTGSAVIGGSDLVRASFSGPLDLYRLRQIQRVK